jgi:pimeloyl-ACP methyl ester carboxylesterase
VPADLVIATDVQLATRDYGGPGQDVLLLHGGGRSMDDWRLVAPLLVDAGLRVAAMDLRGHGRSGPALWDGRTGWPTSAPSSTGWAWCGRRSSGIRSAAWWPPCGQPLTRTARWRST